MLFQAKTRALYGESTGPQVDPRSAFGLGFALHGAWKSPKRQVLFHRGYDCIGNLSFIVPVGVTEEPDLGWLRSRAVRACD